DIYVKELSEIGWFFQGGHTPGFFVQILTLIKDKKFSEVDSLFESYYEEKYTDIFERLSRIYPAIKDNLQEAKNCHELGMYYSSIPLLIILSEYIANKIISKIVGKETRNLLFNKMRVNRPLG